MLKYLALQLQEISMHLVIEENMEEEISKCKRQLLSKTISLICTTKTINTEIKLTNNIVSISNKI